VGRTRQYSLCLEHNISREHFLTSGHWHFSVLMKTNLFLFPWRNRSLSGVVWLTTVYPQLLAFTRHAQKRWLRCILPRGLVRIPLWRAAEDNLLSLTRATRKTPSFHIISCTRTRSVFHLSVNDFNFSWQMYLFYTRVFYRDIHLFMYIQRETSTFLFL